MRGRYGRSRLHRGGALLVEKLKTAERPERTTRESGEVLRMNCLSFEAAINDLARDRMMDAATRNRALAHAVACAQCALRLADEQALTAGLRKMAASAEEAPPSLEASLREAFRATVAAPCEPAVAKSDAGSYRWLRWAAAAAAILLVALIALTAARLRNGETQDQKKEAQQKEEQPAGAPGGVDQKPEYEPHHVAEVRDRTQSGGAPQSGRRGGRRSSSNKKTRPVEAPESSTEIATEFIPLMHGEAMTPSDGGQIVRVEMPRSALVSFGLPMNMERGGGRVKADVVVGNDGLARAIRFVR
jgi:hypothetical protein